MFSLNLELLVTLLNVSVTERLSPVSVVDLRSFKIPSYDNLPILALILIDLLPPTLFITTDLFEILGIFSTGIYKLSETTRDLQ